MLSNFFFYALLWIIITKPSFVTFVVTNLVSKIHKMRNICAKTVQWQNVVSIAVKIKKRIVVKGNSWIISEWNLNPVEHQIWIINQNANSDFRVCIGFHQAVIRHCQPANCSREIRTEMKILPGFIYEKLQLISQNQLLCSNVIGIVNWEFVASRKVDSISVWIIVLWISKR